MQQQELWEAYRGIVVVFVFSFPMENWKLWASSELISDLCKFWFICIVPLKTITNNLDVILNLLYANPGQGYILVSKSAVRIEKRWL